MSKGYFPPCFFFFSSLFFETGFVCVSPAVLEFTLQSRMVSNSGPPAGLWSAGIRAVLTHTQLCVGFVSCYVAAGVYQLRFPAGVLESFMYKITVSANKDTLILPFLFVSTWSPVILQL